MPVVTNGKLPPVTLDFPPEKLRINQSAGLCSRRSGLPGLRPSRRCAARSASRLLRSLSNPSVLIISGSNRNLPDALRIKMVASFRTVGITGPAALSPLRGSFCAPSALVERRVRIEIFLMRFE
jgi:hypothetical protein